MSERTSAHHRYLDSAGSYNRSERQRELIANAAGGVFIDKRPLYP